MAGSTHASNVIALDRCNEAESGTVTRELDPLKLSAPPYLPVATQVAFAIVPLLPFPDASATVDPDPSSNAYAATSPGVAAGVAEPETSTNAIAASTNKRNNQASRRPTRQPSDSVHPDSSTGRPSPSANERLTAPPCIVNAEALRTHRIGSTRVSLVAHVKLRPATAAQFAVQFPRIQHEHRPAEANVPVAVEVCEVRSTCRWASISSSGPAPRPTRARDREGRASFEKSTR